MNGLTPGGVVAALQDLSISHGHVACAVGGGIKGAVPCVAGQRHIVCQVARAKQARQLLILTCSQACRLSQGLPRTQHKCMSGSRCLVLWNALEHYVWAHLEVFLCQRVPTMPSALTLASSGQVAYAQLPEGA